MKDTKEVYVCKKVLASSGRYTKLWIIKNSSLNDRERRIVYMRFVEGRSVAESSEILHIEESSFNKAQKKALVKLYKWLDSTGQI